jgi:hypothetical protein
MIKIKSGHYKFKFNTYNKFWTSVKKALGENFQRKTTNEIFFTAKNPISLEKFIEKKKRVNYDTACSFFSSAKNQLQNLEKYNLTIPFFEMNDFIVIDSSIIIYINNEKILPITDEQIIIDVPYKKSQFFSPELNKLDSLPCKISSKSAIFSLAALIAFLLTNEKPNKEIIENGFFWRIPTPPNEKTNIGNPALLLDLIYNTKLYWALERCLMIRPEQRYCLFI